jgi:hypothetical protein
MTAFSLRAEPIENGCGDSIGCKELRRQSFRATRLVGASDVRNGSEFSNGGLRSEATLKDWLRSPRNLPLIESTNVVFARRPLKRAEIEMLRLRRGQVVECSVSNDTIQSVSPMAVVEPENLNS